MDPIWNELFPAEQERIVELLIERVTIKEDGVDIKFCDTGLETLARDMAHYKQRVAT